eukprot:jgi/Ulvmu1/1443/UM011_0173.1
MSRAYDALYDTVYTVSSAADHYREQARHGGYRVERCPVFETFYSTLAHYPSTSFRLKGRDHVPQYVSREYDQQHRDPRDLRQRSSTALVSGTHRFKYGQRSLLTSNIPIILVKSARVNDGAAQHAAPDPPGAAVGKLSCTIGTQSDYREGEAQTDPYSPEFVLPERPSTKQTLLSQLHNSEGVPELSHLLGLAFGLGDRPGMTDVIHINKLRAKRAFEATLPPLHDVSMLPIRQKMMEEWEEKEWKGRENEIESKQNERLDLLQEAIVARELEVEAAHAQRVQSTTDNLLQAKQRAFGIIQKNRIRGIRHCMEARKYVEKNKWQQQKAESIIDAYANPGSRVYAPPQREGRFPDTRPKGRMIETEHFVPTALAGIEALESYLPKKLLEMKVKAPSGPKQLDYRKRQEIALRNHLDTIAGSLAEARAAGLVAGAPAGGLGYGHAWPAQTSGQIGGTKEMKQRKAVVRNAERPATPVHEPPVDGEDVHRAAALLQRLVRGRAIQNDMLDAADARAALLEELMTPLRAGTTAAAAVPPQHAHVAAMVAAALRPVFMAVASEDVAERQAVLSQLAQQRNEVLAMPAEDCATDVCTGAASPAHMTATQQARPQDAEPMGEAPAAGAAEDEDAAKAATKIQSGFRGLQARKRVAAMRADGAAMREQLNAGATIHDVGGIDLTKFEQHHMDKITKIQAGVRGHLARKQLATTRLQAPDQHQEDAATEPGKQAGADLSGVTAEDERKLVQVQAGIRGYLTRKHMKERSRKPE